MCIRDSISTLQMSLEKLTFLTNSLIKMSRLESGIIPVSYTHLDVYKRQEPDAQTQSR